MPKKGYKQTPEAIRNRSLARIGKKADPAAVERRRQSLLKTYQNRPMSAETKEKIRLANLKWSETHDSAFKGKTHTEEAKRKNSEHCKRHWATHVNPMKGVKMTVEQRALISQRQIELGKDPVIREARRQGQLKYLAEHPEALARLKKQGSDFTLNNPDKVFSFAKRGYREDIDLTCRSTTEANYARYLKFIGVKYLYEPTVFTLSNGQKYTPDFYLPETNKYVEVKGFWKPETFALHTKLQQKYNLFTKEFPEIKLKLLVQTTDEWKAIEVNYSPQIQNWER